MFPLLYILPKYKDKCYNIKVKKLAEIILRGIGQVFFQNNYITGLLFLVGIFYNSVLMGVGALLGTITSTISAKLFKFNSEDISNGLYGYNGTLVGLAITYFYGFNLISVISIILASITSSIVLNLIKQKIPALTSPFIVSTLLIVVFLNLINIPINIINFNSHNIIDSISLGLGQGMFQENIITGLILFIGILINSKKSFVFAFYGSLLGVMISLLLSLPLLDISLGLFSYNAVLCSIYLGSDKIQSYLVVFISVILSIIFYLAIKDLNILILTTPFVLSVWVIKSFSNFNISLIKNKTV